MDGWLGELIGLPIMPRICYAMDRKGQDRYDSLIVLNHGGFSPSNPSFERYGRAFADELMLILMGSFEKMATILKICFCFCFCFHHPFSSTQ
jgi:hypothetical protein